MNSNSLTNQVQFVHLNQIQVQQSMFLVRKNLTRSLTNSRVRFSSANTTNFQPNKSRPSDMTRNILITAALPYVNNTPHLGNIIGGILSADAYARYCRLRGYNTLFVSGTDEYGTTTEVKAQLENTTPQQICDRYHHLHKSIYEWFQVQFDYFGRTSHPLHTSITTEIFQHAASNGYTYTKTVEQFYCPSCDKSLADRYVVGLCSACGGKAKGDQCDSCSNIFKDPIKQLIEPKCSVCKSTPVTKSSTHLYFSLSKSVPFLTQWLTRDEGLATWSNNARSVTKAWLNMGLQDRCITRDLRWGVPVPPGYLDSSKVFYVWFEAPIGYISITAAGLGEGWREWWQPIPGVKVELNQFMGKDNIAFHSILAPATLQCTGQDYVRPKKLAVTEYLLYEGGKFSKSNSVGVFGDDCAQTNISSDVWRFYLLMNRPETYDTEFTWEDLATVNKKYLLNVIGNMFHRILKYTYTKLGRRIPPLRPTSYTQHEHDLVREMSRAIHRYCQEMERVELKAGAHTLIEMGEIMNKYIQETEFWAKQHTANSRNQDILAVAIRVLEVYGLLIKPYLPATSHKLAKLIQAQSSQCTEMLKAAQPEVFFQSLFLSEQLVEEENKKWQSRTLSNPEVFFHQISNQSLKVFKEKYGNSAAKGPKPN